MSRNSRKKNQQTIVKEYHITKNYNYYINDENINNKNPTTLIGNMFDFILILCLFFIAYLTLTPLFIKNGINEVDIYNNFITCLFIDAGFLIDYFFAFRILYYSYIYNLQNKIRNIGELIQSIMSIAASAILPYFISLIFNSKDNNILSLYYSLFLSICSPMWIFLAELFFLLKNFDTYKKINKADTNRNLKEYINKTILLDNKHTIESIALAAFLLIIEFDVFFIM